MITQHSDYTQTAHCKKLKSGECYLRQDKKTGKVTAIWDEREVTHTRLCFIAHAESESTQLAKRLLPPGQCCLQETSPGCFKQHTDDAHFGPECLCSQGNSVIPLLFMCVCLWVCKCTCVRVCVHVWRDKRTISGIIQGRSPCALRSLCDWLGTQHVARLMAGGSCRNYKCVLPTLGFLAVVVRVASVWLLLLLWVLYIDQSSCLQGECFINWGISTAPLPWIWITDLVRPPSNLTYRKEKQGEGKMEKVFGVRRKMVKIWFIYMKL